MGDVKEKRIQKQQRRQIARLDIEENADIEYDSFCKDLLKPDEVYYQDAKLQFNDFWQQYTSEEGFDSDIDPEFKACDCSGERLKRWGCSCGADIDEDYEGESDDDITDDEITWDEIVKLKMEANLDQSKIKKQLRRQIAWFSIERKADIEYKAFCKDLLKQETSEEEDYDSDTDPPFIGCGCEGPELELDGCVCDYTLPFPTGAADAEEVYDGYSDEDLTEDEINEDEIKELEMNMNLDLEEVRENRRRQLEGEEEEVKRVMEADALLNNFEVLNMEDSDEDNGQETEETSVEDDEEEVIGIGMSLINFN